MTDANLTLYVIVALAMAVALPWVMPNLFGLKNLRKQLNAQGAASTAF
ncbi:hypothetical protein [Burkholderia cenocepacia]|nr:hypothetical protein [Burkholderia cenocepacia]